MASIVLSLLLISGQTEPRYSYKNVRILKTRRVSSRMYDSQTLFKRHLSNDPGNTEVISFVDHIGMFSFSHREWINLPRDSLRNKMYLNSIFKGCFLVLKDFDHAIIRVTNNSQEKFTILHVPPIGFQCYTKTRIFCYKEVGLKAKD